MRNWRPASAELILNGTYPPGSLLPNEAEWGRRFRASRTAVREAIRTLNGKGLLVSRPKIGSRVEPRERWNLLDRDVMAWHRAAMDERSFLLALQEVRRILEPGVAVLAASRRTDEQLAALEAALDAMRAASDPRDMVQADVELPPPPAGRGQQRACWRPSASSSSRRSPACSTTRPGTPQGPSTSCRCTPPW